jgi:hypothetical protein
MSNGNDESRIKGTVVVVLRDAATGKVKHKQVVDNVVTFDGDVYYAEVCALKTPTNAFGSATGRMAMNDSNGGAVPARTDDYSDLGSAVGSGNPKAFDSLYPHVNDSDADNPGVQLTQTTTYRTSYTTAEANGDIGAVAIYLNGASATDPILMNATFDEFTKTSNDTLKVFVNHRFTGV